MSLTFSDQPSKPECKFASISKYLLVKSSLFASLITLSFHFQLDFDLIFPYYFVGSFMLLRCLNYFIQHFKAIFSRKVDSNNPAQAFHIPRNWSPLKKKTHQMASIGNPNPHWLFFVCFGVKRLFGFFCFYRLMCLP